MANKIDNNFVKQLDLKYVFHSWSVQKDLDPLPIKGALGSYVWDFNGKKYLDFSSQLINTNIGHQHPKVIESIIEQSKILTTISPYHANLTRANAARLVLKHAPNYFKKVFFTNAGADAIENAIRMARIYSSKHKILSGYRSYHGNTGSAINATGDWRRIANEYAIGHVHFFTPYTYRSEFNAKNDVEETSRALKYLERIIQVEGPSSIAGILLESIPGTAGILVPTKEYMQGVKYLSEKYEILLIIDEIMTGFGRTGKWFCFENYGINPDLVTFAKGVNSGYVPAGGVIISDKIVDYFNDKMFPGGLTYSGHPLSMSSIVANISVMEEEKVVENAFKIGKEVFSNNLKKMESDISIVGNIRGIGVFWAIELVSNQNTKYPLTMADMNKIRKELIKEGILPFISENRIHIAPACNITKEDATKGLEIVYSVLKKFDKYF